MVVKFLFWNVQGHDVSARLSVLVNSLGINVLVLAECEHPKAMAKRLSAARRKLHRAPSSASKLMLFSNLNVGLPVSEGGHFCIWRLPIRRGKEVLLAAAHLRSPLFARSADHALACRDLARKVEEAEDAHGHRRTLVVGDLNCNPYDAGLVNADTLNAVMSKRVAAKERRTVQGKSYLFFYNPMWSHFGDLRKEAAATYFYYRGNVSGVYWHMFDQVLLRPSLAAGFKGRDLAIIEKIEGESLLGVRSGAPRSEVSDHLPLSFRIML